MQLQEDSSAMDCLRNPHDYEEAVAHMKAYLIARGTWLDEHIDSLRHYAHESVNKKYNH